MGGARGQKPVDRASEIEMELIYLACLHPSSSRTALPAEVSPGPQSAEGIPSARAPAAARIAAVNAGTGWICRLSWVFPGFVVIAWLLHLRAVLRAVLRAILPPTRSGD